MGNGTNLTINLMSLKSNDQYLERMQENFEEARIRNERMKMIAILRELRGQGFEKEAAALRSLVWKPLYHDVSEKLEQVAFEHYWRRELGY